MPGSTGLRRPRAHRLGCGDLCESVGLASGRALPGGYMLSAFPDGVRFIGAELDLSRSVRFVRIGDS